MERIGSLRRKTIRIGLIVAVLAAGVLSESRAVAVGPDRMSGRGTVTSTGASTAGFDSTVDCDHVDADSNPYAHFDIEWDGSTFEATDYTAVSCVDDPAIPGTPPSGFDRQDGTAGGTVNGASGYTLSWTHIDGGPGASPSDKTTFQITDPDLIIVLEVPQQTPGTLDGYAGGTFSGESDSDQWPDDTDNCPNHFNPGQEDADGDGVGDACETEGPPGNSNGAGGVDDCSDGADNDGDGETDSADEACNDDDGDEVDDEQDNCPGVFNPDQKDTDGDGTGDACDATPTPSPCTIVGTEGPDILTGTNKDDVICGLGGADTINGGSGDDILIGGQGDDTLGGGNGNDSLFGGNGNDLMSGGNGNDTLSGADGNDSMFGDNGADALAGEGGDDNLTGGHGSDSLDGGSGIDTCSDPADTMMNCP